MAMSRNGRFGLCVTGALALAAISGGTATPLGWAEDGCGAGMYYNVEINQCVFYPAVGPGPVGPGPVGPGPVGPGPVGPGPVGPGPVGPGR